jgi:hypothetical protein
MHRHLYKDDMPQWILRAFSVCMLYINGNEANRAVVLRALEENIDDVKSSAPATTLTPLEKLARAQALIVYQSIRMFDGDITLGQQAERDNTLLELWIDELRKIRDNLGDYVDKSNAEIRSKPPESWEVSSPHSTSPQRSSS